MQADAPPPGQPAAAAPPFAPVLPRPQVTFGSLVGRTFSVWKNNLLRFAGVTLLIQLPSLVLSWAVGSPFVTGSASFARPPPEFSGFVFGRAWVATVVVGALLGLVHMSALTAGAVQYLAGRPASVGEMLAAGLRRALPVLVAGVLALLAVYGGLFLLIVPGVIIGLMLSLVVPVVTTERLGPIKSLGRSRALTKGHRWKILGTVFVAYLVVATPAALVGWLSYSIPAAGWILNAVVSAILGSLLYVVPAVAYHDLRVAKEGVATAELARVFE